MKVGTYKAYLFDLYGTLADIHTDEWKLPFWSVSTLWISKQ